MDKNNDGISPQKHQPQPKAENLACAETGNRKGKINMSMTMEQIQATSKITSKGQVTIPVEIRNVLEIKEGDQLRFVLKDGVVTIEPIIHLSAEKLFGIFNSPEDNGDFVLDLNLARESRSTEIMKKYGVDSGGD
jgi:antitoxin PrlF